MFCAKILKVSIVKHSEFEIACQVLESYHPSWPLNREAGILTPASYWATG